MTAVTRKVPPLLRTPVINTEESLLSYFVRLSEANGYRSPMSLVQLWGYEGHTTNGSLIRLFADLANKPEETLLANAWVGKRIGKQSFAVRGTLAFHRGLVFKKTTRICPECVRENGFASYLWEIVTLYACPRHRRLLLDACPSCRRSITWDRPGVLKCRCGAALDVARPWRPSATEYQLVQLLHAKLSGRPAPEICDQALLQLQHRSAEVTTEIIDVLARYCGVNLLNSRKTVEHSQHVHQRVAMMLEGWPDSLVRAAAGVDQGYLGVPSTHGRDRFLRFLRWANGSRYPSEMGFIRDILSRPRRYVVAHEYAKRVGAHPARLKRAIERGYIVGIRVRTLKQTRFFVDTEKSKALPTKPFPRTKKPKKRSRPEKGMKT